MKIHIPSLLSFPLLLGSAMGATNQYARDDGSAEAALGYGVPQDYCWMQWFDAVGGADTITSIQAYIPSTTPVGTPITFCVWNDPSNDGNPIDAMLVSMTTTTVQQGGPNVFMHYPLLQAAPVTGRFFVGAYLTENGTMSPAALDYSTNPHVAWFSFNSPGAFDPARLWSNFPPTHIETLGAGIHGVFMLRAQGGSGLPVTYCTAKVNSLGCLPTIGSIGVPSASAPSGFVIYAQNVRNRQNGLLFYGTTGRASDSFLGGTLCAAAPLRRTRIQSSGGSLGLDDCSGTYVLDFNAWMHSGADPMLVPGTTVNAQYYSRDPGFPAPNNVGLTQGIEFTIQL